MFTEVFGEMGGRSWISVWWPTDPTDRVVLGRKLGGFRCCGPTSPGQEGQEEDGGRQGVMMRAAWEGEERGGDHVDVGTGTMGMPTNPPERMRTRTAKALGWLTV